MIACKDSTADTVIKVIEKHVILPFCAPKKIISDNATCFSAKSLLNFMNEHGTEWKTVMAYAPVSNGKAERMVGTIKRSITKTVLKSKQEWDEAIDQVVYGYRRRRNSNGYSPYQLMYGHPPRIANTDSTSPINNSDSDPKIARNLELLATENLRAEQRLSKSKPKCIKGKILKFHVGEKVLVAHGNATKKNVGWPAFKSKFYGPCKIRKAFHPYYELESRSGKRSRKGIHARRLIKFTERIDEAITIETNLVMNVQSCDEPVKNYLKLNIDGKSLRNWMKVVEEDISKQQELSYYVISICLCFNKVIKRTVTDSDLEILERIMFSFQDGIFQPLGSQFARSSYFFSIGSFENDYQPPKDHMNALSFVYLILTGKDAPYLSHFELQPDFSSPTIPYPYKKPYSLDKEESEDYYPVSLAREVQARNIVIHSYGHIILGDDPVRSWLDSYLLNDDESHDLGHYMIHICLSFKFFSSDFLDPENFQILRRLFVSFQEQRFRDIHINFIFYIYHYSVARYGNCGEDDLSESYLQVILPVIQSLRSNPNPQYVPFYLDPDLEVQTCPYPFVAPFQIEEAWNNHNHGNRPNGGDHLQEQI